MGSDMLSNLKKVEYVFLSYIYNYIYIYIYIYIWYNLNFFLKSIHFALQSCSIQFSWRLIPDYFLCLAQPLIIEPCLFEL